MAPAAKFALPAAAAALLAVAAGVAAVRASRRPVPSSPREPSAPAPAAAAPAPSPPPEAAPPPSSVAQACSRFLKKLEEERALRDIRRPSGPVRDATTLMAGQEESRRAAEDLAAVLAREPAGWGEVLELLSGLEDSLLGTRFGALLAPAVDDATEPAVVDLLRTGPLPAARRAAAAMLSRRSSLESLQALLAAAQDDPDPGVRLEAITEAFRRRASAPSENARILIDETVRKRSLAETDPNVRELVKRFLPAERPAPPPPRPSRRPLSPRKPAVPAPEPPPESRR